MIRCDSEADSIVWMKEDDGLFGELYLLWDYISQSSFSFRDELYFALEKSKAFFMR